MRPTPENSTYPIFEVNQVLTSDHLNESFNYLDEQERLTRANLTGIGIVCGFEIQIDPQRTTITISKGCGITSQGYLLIEPDDVALVAKRLYTPPKALDYPLFNGTVLWELVETVEPGAQALAADPKFLDDKVVLLFLELDDESLRNCSPANCDDKGSAVNVTLRRLLMSKADAVALLKATEGFAEKLDVSGVAALITARLDLPDLRLRRFDVPNSNVDNAQEIFLAYQKILLEKRSESHSTSFFQHVGKALSKAYYAFQPLLVSLEKNDPFSDFLAGVLTEYRACAGNSNVIYSQYFYDFLDDLIQAYDEFRWKGIDLMTLCCPSDDVFPRHLILGELFGTPDRAGRKVFRTYFHPSAAMSGQAKLVEEVRHLFQRLVAMVKTFRMPILTKGIVLPAGIKITPSRLGAFLLSEKAIPFYYRNTGSPQLYQRWNFEKTAVGREKQNLGYHADLYAVDDFVKTPLEYDFEPNNFFRIEGHVGMHWRQAVSDLLAMITANRLPFDVVALNADNLAVQDDPQPQHCVDNDLDVIYKLWVQELGCLFAKKINYLTAYNVQNLTVGVANRAFRVKAAMAPGAPTVEATATPRTIVVASVAELATPVSRNIVDAAVKDDGTIGSVFLDQVSKGVLPKINDMIVGMSDTIKAYPALQSLPTSDFEVLIGQPVELVAAMYDFSATIPEGIADIDYTTALAKYNTVRETAGLYLDAIQKLPVEYAHLTPEQRQQTVQQLTDLLDNCLHKQLTQLSAELDARKQKLERLIYFHEYVKKHPDIQHKAGVPIGGTFIVIFRESPLPDQPTAVAANTQATETTVVAEPAGALPLKSMRSGVVQPSLAATMQVRPKMDIVNSLMQELTLHGVNLSVDELNTLADSVMMTSTVTLEGLFTIPEGVVIADFYVPSRCCSDCPPIQYVLPAPRPAFTALPRCAVDEKQVPVDVRVLHGATPFEIKIDSGEYHPLANNLVLVPPGHHTLTLRDADGEESVAVDVDVPYRMSISIQNPQCTAAQDSYNIDIHVVHGKPSFLVNNSVPISSTDNADGSFTLKAGPFASGANLTIQVSDSSPCPPATQPYMFTCAPLARQDDITIDYGATRDIDVLTNDLPAGGLSVTAVTPAAGGATSIIGSTKVRFIANQGFTGTTTFNYTVVNAGGSATATVTVHVLPKPCTEPCEGKAEVSRYLLWLAQPADKVPYQNYSTVRATMTIVENKTSSSQSIDCSNAFGEALPSKPTALTAKIYAERLPVIISGINEITRSKMGSNLVTFSYSPNEPGLLTVEHYLCYTFTFEIEFSFAVDGITVSEKWKYGIDSVAVISTVGRLNAASATTTSEATFKKFGVIEIDKCADTRGTDCKVPLEGISSKPMTNSVTVVPSVRVITGNAPLNYFWKMEWGIPLFSNGQTVEVATSTRSGNFRVRLVVIDGKNCWGYSESILNALPMKAQPKKK